MLISQKISSESSAAALALFSSSWAIATLLHLLSELHTLPPWPNISLISLEETILGLVAIALLRRPTSLPRLGSLAALQILAIIGTAPKIGNHWLFTAFLNGAILAILIYHWRQNRALPTADTFLAQWAPIARLSLIIFWLIAAVNKLNSDFLLPEVSCVTLFYTDLLYWVGLKQVAWLQTPLLHQLIIYATLLTEFAIPLLLISSRGRLLGVMLGLLFHFLLAIDPARHFFDFSSMLYALYFLFVAPDFPLWAQTAVRQRLSNPKPLLNFLSLTLLLLLFSRLQYRVHIPWRLLVIIGRQTLWTTYGLTMLSLFITYLYRQPRLATKPIFKLPHAVALIIPALVLLNGLSPHLGLKTGFSINMYSNLRTEGDQPNHLFLPALRLIPHQDDIITILQTDDPALQSYADRDYALLYYEFRAYLSTNPVIVTYLRDGQIYLYDPLHPDPAFSPAQPLNPLLRKLFMFRPVDLQPHKRCLTGWGAAY